MNHLALVGEFVLECAEGLPFKLDFCAHFWIINEENNNRVMFDEDRNDIVFYWIVPNDTAPSGETLLYRAFSISEPGAKDAIRDFLLWDPSWNILPSREYPYSGGRPIGG